MPFSVELDITGTFRLGSQPEAKPAAMGLGRRNADLRAPYGQKIHSSLFPDQNHPFDCHWRRPSQAARPKPEICANKTAAGPGRPTAAPRPTPPHPIGQNIHPSQFPEKRRRFDCPCQPRTHRLNQNPNLSHQNRCSTQRRQPQRPVNTISAMPHITKR